MDERTRQRERDEVFAGAAPQEVLRRTAATTRGERDRALAELGELLTDEQVFTICRLDMAVLRQGPRLGRGVVAAVTAVELVRSARREAESAARRDRVRLLGQAAQASQARAERVFPVRRRCCRW